MLSTGEVWFRKCTSEIIVAALVLGCGARTGLLVPNGEVDAGSDSGGADGDLDVDEEIPSDADIPQDAEPDTDHDTYHTSCDTAGGESPRITVGEDGISTVEDAVQYRLSHYSEDVLVDIFIPAGTYTTSTIDWPTCTRGFGEGVLSTIISPLESCVHAVSPVVEAIDTDGVLFENIGFPTNYTCGGLSIEHGTTVYLNNISGQVFIYNGAGVELRGGSSLFLDIVNANLDAWDISCHADSDNAVFRFEGVSTGNIVNSCVSAVIVSGRSNVNIAQTIFAGVLRLNPDVYPVSSISGILVADSASIISENSSFQAFIRSPTVDPIDCAVTYWAVNMTGDIGSMQLHGNVFRRGYDANWVCEDSEVTVDFCEDPSAGVYGPVGYTDYTCSEE